MNMSKLFYKIKKLFFYFNKKRYLEFIFFIFCLVFIFKKTFNEFMDVKNIIEFDHGKYLIILIISLINLNIMNIRFYYILKKITKYSDNFINWSRLFFQTAIMNLLLTGTGHFFRAIQLKKKNLKYSEFISLNYVIYLISNLVNMLLFVTLFYMITNKAIIAILGIIIILLASYFLTNKKVYEFFLNFLKKDIKFFKKYKQIFINLLFHCKKFFLFKKNLIIFSLITLLIFFLEGVIIYLISSTILLNESVFNNLLLFFLVSYLNKFPYMQNIIGLNELIVGLFAESLGILFLQGALIQLIFRLSIYTGCILNNFLYLILKLKNK